MRLKHLNGPGSTDEKTNKQTNKYILIYVDVMYTFSSRSTLRLKSNKIFALIKHHKKSGSYILFRFFIPIFTIKID